MSESATLQAAVSKSTGGEAGTVDYLFTIGAPGSATPGLQKKGSACFPGHRLYSTEKGKYWGHWADFAVRYYDGHFDHPAMETIEIRKDAASFEVGACHDSRIVPNFGTVSKALHLGAWYLGEMNRAGSERQQDFTYFASTPAYEHDVDKAREMVESRSGWRLVGSVIGSYEIQVSHLIQHEPTLECAILFQGTNSATGWWSDNGDDKPDHFCGLVASSEVCEESPCTPNDPMSSFVHRGMKERLIRVVNTTAFQENILEKLPGCGSVSVIGHSAGGAVSELFTACVASAPAEGEFGYDEYQHMAWQKGTPTQLWEA